MMILQCGDWRIRHFKDQRIRDVWLPECAVSISSATDCRGSVARDENLLRTYRFSPSPFPWANQRKNRQTHRKTTVETVPRAETAVDVGQTFEGVLKRLSSFDIDQHRADETDSQTELWRYKPRLDRLAMCRNVKKHTISRVTSFWSGTRQPHCGKLPKRQSVSSAVGGVSYSSVHCSAGRRKRRSLAFRRCTSDDRRLSCCCPLQWPPSSSF